MGWVFLFRAVRPCAGIMHWKNGGWKIASFLPLSVADAIFAATL
jgi:hypothetical protein